MDAGSLADALKDGHALPTHALRLVTRRILQGVRYLHKQKILHRDIKPGNILVSKKGEIKLSDFGLAVSVDKYQEKGLDISQKGTRQFMDLRRLEGVFPSDAHAFGSDIWSLGMTIYCLAVGTRTPFTDNPGHFEMMEKVRCLEKSMDMTSLKGEPQLIDFLKKCLRQDPKRRPSARRLLKHAFVEKSKIDISKVKIWVRPHCKASALAEASDIADRLAIYYAKRNRVQNVSVSKPRKLPSLQLQSTPRRDYTPPKGSRRRGRDHAVAASAPAHDKSDHKQNLSKPHKLPSMATRREYTPSKGPRRSVRVGTPPLAGRGLSKTINLRGKSMHKATLDDARFPTPSPRCRPSSAPNARYNASTGPTEDAISNLATQLGLKKEDLWNMFVRKMPGLKPYYAMRDKTSFLRPAPKLVNKNAKVASNYHSQDALHASAARRRLERTLTGSRLRGQTLERAGSHRDREKISRAGSHRGLEKISNRFSSRP